METLKKFFCVILAFQPILFAKAQSSDFKDLRFIFVYGNSTSKFIIVPFNATKNLLNHPEYDNNRPTMLYGYGYTEKYTSLSTQTVVKAFIDRRDHNIFVIEWSNYSDGNYVTHAIPNSHKVGDEVALQLLKMKVMGFKLDKFCLVGHSLGAHLVGFIGRAIIKFSNGTSRITRITGLDPAGPLFYGIAEVMQKPINKDDGLFVDVIRTDFTFFGAPSRKEGEPIQTGTVDFWPNGGFDQPKCPPPDWDITKDDSKASIMNFQSLKAFNFRFLFSSTFVGLLFRIRSPAKRENLQCNFLLFLEEFHRA